MRDKGTRRKRKWMKIMQFISGRSGLKQASLKPYAKLSVVPVNPNFSTKETKTKQ